MIDTKRKEEMSLSYLIAVAAVNGIAVELKRHDDDGIDAELHKIVTRNDGAQFRASLSVQMKSTATVLRKQDDNFHYDLKAKNYNDLRRNSRNPQYLFVLMLPKKPEEWLSHSVDELIIRKCMYWSDPATWQDVNNSSTVSVNIPKTNMLTPDALLELIKKSAE